MPTGPKQRQSDAGPDDKCTDDISYHGLIVYTIVFVIAPLCVACASGLIILGKYYPVNAECLQPWTSPIPQQLWKHLTPQRIELPLHPSVNVTRPWMCEQWHQWSHPGHSRPPLRTVLLWSWCQGWRGSGEGGGGNGAFGYTAFVMRALPRARQRSREQLGVKRRQAGTSCKDEDDSKDVRLKWKHSQILEREWKILW